MHIRQQIRERAAALLVAVDTQTWQRVFTQREVPLRAVKPYLLVYTPTEASTPATVHQPYLLQRDATLIVQAHVRIADVESVEETFDAVAVEIEQTLTYRAMQANVAKLSGIYLINTQTDIIVNENNERQYGQLTLTYQAQYHATEGNPE